ncbi:MAG: glycosyltransferase family 39 protein [Bacteroidetes bacterium]|nr:glycosyltransferase family 39 protein [Bacteroidota bacterium]
MNLLRKIKAEYWLLLAGLLFRVIFVLFLAKPYFGRENIFVDGDTYSFASPFQSLIETGSFTVNPGLEYGYFARMPGYPFFIGIFYLITGQNWENSFRLIAGIQLLLDLLTAWLLFLITLQLFRKRSVALITLAVYITYPFIIVWVPVIYAELLGVNITVIAFWFFVFRNRKNYLYYSGLFLGIGILVRPQCVLILPAFILVLCMDHFRESKLLLKKMLQLMVFMVLIFSVWPLRNYINHKKVIFTQDLRGFYNWNEDALAFLQYIYSVKAEWEPQYSQIIHNQKVVFPKEAYSDRSDSLLLEKAVTLCQNCGSGFSHKTGYWKQPFDYPNCNQEIKEIFSKLRQHQIEKNPLNFYIRIPLQNLQKAIFKSKLNDSASMARKIASLLFYYRTLLILAGLAGVFTVKKAYWKECSDLIIFPCFFLILYLVICAGTSVQLRNIEMRYFLPADILLLIPAGALFSNIIGRWLKRT